MSSTSSPSYSCEVGGTSFTSLEELDQHKRQLGVLEVQQLGNTLHMVKTVNRAFFSWGPMFPKGPHLVED
ncbi:MAG: hypothetical protein WB988_17150 [Candidatus Nitrosopolaris sp.]|jgi:hypothetical protein